MQNYLESLSEIFTKRIFRIPDYQRGYAWKDEQLNDFWDDLQDLFDDHYHYTGLLSIKEININDFSEPDDVRWLIDNGYALFHIVDGQQRLTTFIILLNEILNLVKTEFKSEDNPSSTEINIAYTTNKYIYQSQPNADFLKTYLFGYEKDNPSSQYLKNKILNDNKQIVKETYYTLNLQQAKDYFAIKLNELYEDGGKVAITELYTKLTERFKFNVYEIDDDYDVFVAFETMNNRGKSLTNLELLKNRLIYLTTIFPNSTLTPNQKNQLRQNINEAWKEIYYQLGRNKKHPLDDDEFLKAHWIAKFKYTRSDGDDYINFLLSHFNTKNIRNSDNRHLLRPNDIDEYIESLKQLAQHWYYTFFPVESQFISPEEIMWLDRLNRIGIAHFRPMVAISLMKGSSEERINLYKNIERFIFCLLRFGNFFAESYKSNDIYIKSGNLFNDDISMHDISEWLNEQIESNINALPQNFITKMQTNFDNRKGYYSWKALKYFLYEYESSLLNPSDEPKIDWEHYKRNESSRVSVEHIFPQTPSNYYWRNMFRQFNDEEINYLTNSIGNLLPLSQSKNSALQNDSFPEKCNPSNKAKHGYSKGSFSELEVAELSDWTAVEIFNRGKKLLDFLSKRWNLKLSDDIINKLTFVEFAYDGRMIPPELDKIQIVPPAEIPDDINKARTKYWEWILPSLKEEFGSNGPFSKVGPSKESYMNGWYNISGVHIYMQILPYEYQALVGLYIDAPKSMGGKKTSQKIFDAINNHKDEIVESINYETKWDRNDGNDVNCCTVKVLLNDIDFKNVDNWLAIRKFHIKMTKYFTESIIYRYQEEIETAKMK